MRHVILLFVVVAAILAATEDVDDSETKPVKNKPSKAKVPLPPGAEVDEEKEPKAVTKKSNSQETSETTEQSESKNAFSFLSGIMEAIFNVIASVIKTVAGSSQNGTDVTSTEEPARLTVTPAVFRTVADVKADKPVKKSKKTKKPRKSTEEEEEESEEKPKKSKKKKTKKVESDEDE